MPLNWQPSADVISVSHWDEDHRWPGIALRSLRQGADAAGQVRWHSLDVSAAAREGRSPPAR
jgi:hypothetical protein